MKMLLRVNTPFRRNSSARTRKNNGRKKQPVEKQRRKVDGT
jgi:hypothetical protein